MISLEEKEKEKENDDLLELIDNLDPTINEKKTGDDFIIKDPEQFIKDYNNYLTYSNIDDFTIIALIESYFFSKSHELILTKSGFITAELFKTLMNLYSCSTIEILRLQNLEIKGKAIKLLSKCRHMNLKELEIDSCAHIEPDAIVSFFQANGRINVIKKLNKIIIKNMNIEDQCITSILNSAHKMKELKEFVFIECSHFSPRAFENLYTNKFDKISLLHFEKIAMSEKVLGIFASSETLNTLESLTLIKIQGLTDTSLLELFKSPFLVNLKVFEMRFLKDIKGLFLNEFQSKASCLTSFKVSDMDQLTQENVDNFLKLSVLPELQILELSQCYFILDTFITTFTSLQFPKLEELTMNYYLKMSSTSLVNLLSSQTTNTIKILNLENCTGLYDLPRNIPALSKCDLKKLEKLNLNYCAKLSPNLIQGIGSIVSLINLKILCLNGIQTLDDNTSLYLTKSNYLQNLKELYIENCPNITIKSFQEWMRCPLMTNLEILSLNGNSQLNDEIWGYFVKSQQLKKLRDIRLKGLNVTSEGVDKLIFSEKMRTIEYISLTNACFAFPSFYDTDKCKNLKKIEGSWDNVSPEDVESLLQSEFLSSEFQFQDIINQVVMDDTLLELLTKSVFLKKVWEFPQSDKISSEKLEAMMSSENLNPFFNIDSFLKNNKSVIDDNILTAMANNKLCVNNLFELDIEGCKNVTSTGIKAILLSKHLSQLFNVSGFIQSIKSDYANQADDVISILSQGNFAQKIRKLDLGDYDFCQQTTDDFDLDSKRIFKKIFLKTNIFVNLRALNLSKTNIDDKDLIHLAENSLMNLLVVLNLNNNPTISSDGFRIFLEAIIEKDLALTRLDVEYCKITNDHLKILTESTLGRQLRVLSLAGCKDIDGVGLECILNMSVKKINMKNIYEDFKHFIKMDEKNKQHYTIVKEVDADTTEIFQLLKNSNEEKKNKKKNDKEKKRFKIRDKVMIDLCKEKRIDDLKKINLRNCAITSKLLIEMANSVHMKKLVELILENTNVDDEGIKALCQSKYFVSLQKLETNYCNYLGKESLKAILIANFHSSYNPDEMLSHFAQKVDTEILKLIPISRFFKNMRDLNFTTNNDFNLKDLYTLMNMQKENVLLRINVNINQIFNKNKSDINDDVLIDLSDSKILSITKILDLAGSTITEEGLQALFTSKYINLNFYVQPVINFFGNLIDDDRLNAISRGGFFKNITEINLKSCPKISLLGLLNIARSPNPYFKIQVLLDDFGDKIDSLFVKNMVQQDYFENLESLKLTDCKRLNTGDLLTIIKASHENFDLEKFIVPENLPYKNPDLITNEVLKAISQSAYFMKYCVNENTDDDLRYRFTFDIRAYRQVDYGINYLIEQDAAPIDDYDDYLQNFAYYLSHKSLAMVNTICQKNPNREDVKNMQDQLSHVKKLDFSQNKQIYNTSFKLRLTDAFESFQNAHNLNLENETIEHFVTQVIQVQDEFNFTADADEEFKDLIIFNIIKNCQNLEEINLNNLNLGDYFLKLFSLYITEEKKNLTIHLPLLKVFKIKNNGRFTSVGLKYLYCSAVKRTNIEDIDVSYKGQFSSGITYFVNNGLNGMIDYYIFFSFNRLKLIYDKKRRRIAKFLINRKSLSILGLYLLTSPILFFHLLEKVIYYTPFVFAYILKPCKPLYKSYRRCISNCMNCFGDYFHQQKEKEKENTILTNVKSPTEASPYPSSAMFDSNINQYSKKSTINKPKSCCKKLFSCLDNDYNNNESRDFHENLRERFIKSMNNLKEAVGKDYDVVKDQSLFYFDESLIILNSILGHKSDIKTNQVISTSTDQQFSDYQKKMTNKFYFISKLKWIFLVNFFMYYTITLFYLIFLKITFNQNADLKSQIPYFAYAGFNLIMEFLLCVEVILTINNPRLINISSNMLISNLISSQAAKYDLFTDVSFVLSNYEYNPVTKTSKYGNIFIASLSVLALKIVLNFFEFCEFFYKNFLKKNKNSSSYSSKNINTFSKTCFVFEFHALGRLLDKFSTASAKKYKYWWLPKSSNGDYCYFHKIVYRRCPTIDYSDL